MKWIWCVWEQLGKVYLTHLGLSSWERAGIRQALSSQPATKQEGGLGSLPECGEAQRPQLSCWPPLDTAGTLSRTHDSHLLPLSQFSSGNNNKSSLRKDTLKNCCKLVCFETSDPQKVHGVNSAWGWCAFGNKVSFSFSAKQMTL